jgi:hypothetical protein
MTTNHCASHPPRPGGLSGGGQEQALRARVDGACTLENPPSVAAPAHVLRDSRMSPPCPVRSSSSFAAPRPTWPRSGR